ncbi:MAG: hypothetical protein A3F17_01740 [Gammaproteobacteria bacterium RIFCSPHIGHO2_12_FULL_41_15]|nr:MAG: hypothetical protein A3F17_01740 [Gammaproteobacteria bacterium RIFCSPHIGHO2_12_FULL_41_15]
MKDVLVNKITLIQRSLKRIHEEYDGHENELESNETKQDAILLNLQRACESSIDIAAYLIKENALGIPETSRNAFQLLINNKLIPPELGESLKKMVGFRNIAIHNYETVNLSIVKSILDNKLSDFEQFCQLILEMNT